MASGAGVSRKRPGLTARSRLKHIGHVSSFILLVNTQNEGGFNLLSVGVSGREAIAPVDSTQDAQLQIIST